MAYRALTGLGLPFDLIRAEDIKTGALNKYKMLFVPGGWASNKIKALGETGAAAIRDFVSDGGSYLGFCGGAGLATTGKDGIGLLNIKRRPTKERVPSFSGKICLNITKHTMWDKLPPQPPLIKGGSNSELRTPNSKLVFHAWWPSQFIIDDDNIKILAKYGDALPDAFSSDLNVGDVGSDSRWEELEKVYQINLNPNRLKNEPAVIEGMYGKGKVILSLVHFDTPDDINGQHVLLNLWEYLTGEQTDNRTQSTEHGRSRFIPSLEKGGRGGCDGVPEFFTMCAELISLGERNFLWFWRNSMLLQWRRGVRGLEYNTLYIMMKAISVQIAEHRAQITDKQLDEIKDVLVPFVEKAKKLLLLERHALQKGHITYERCDDPEIKKLRIELFSESKSHGGKFKELLDEIDKLLFSLLT
ncbi:MAG: hypothetical protein HZC49_10760 [Nitrospirae bacterium]|nr:hypothetical protein [Nitrospirota bacterium]